MSDQPGEIGAFAVSPQVINPASVAIEEVERFSCIPRKDYGTLGHPIQLRANHFQVQIPDVSVFHYEVLIEPDGCPRRVNRAVFEELVNTQYSTVQSWKLTVFDGLKTMFSKEWLPILNGSSTKVQLPGTGLDRPFHVAIKWKGEVNLRHLSRALLGISAIPEDGMYALDVILRQLPSMRLTPVGKSFFEAPSGNAQFSLAGGREIWLGYHQSLKPSRWKMTMNIDVTATAFYKDQSVLDLLCEVLTMKDLSHLNEPLSEQHRLRFCKEITGLKVEVTHAGKKRRKYRIQDVTKRTAHTQTFPLKTVAGHHVNCRVSKYFADKYSFVLEYPNLPCLVTGSDSNPIYLPMEVCNILPGQRCKKRLSETQTSAMIKATAKSAPQRESQINKLVSETNFQEDPFLKSFGVTVDTHMSQIQGRVIAPPKLQYGANGQQIAVPQRGVWHMTGRKFIHGAEVKTWAVLSFCTQQMVSQNTIVHFVRKFVEAATGTGMDFAEQPSYMTYLQDISSVASTFKLLKEEYKHLKLILVFLPGKTPIYAEIKRVGDLYCGVSTQCVQARNVQRPSPQIFSNLCLKINTKLGGINNILMPTSRPSNVFREPVIFIGAHIAHPAGVDRTKPSIAAVVGSIDAHPCRYSTTVRVQNGKGDIIEEMTNMVKEVLRNFYYNTRFKPQRIVIYRDGVADGNLAKVLNLEMGAVRRACLELEEGYMPGITFIVVQKRHHTRIFCADERERVGRSGNIPAGTTVDTGITHPSAADFYMCSHAGLQGTSRPSHYNVLWDDSDFSADDLQQLTYQLCHTYSRCTRSVSVPTPVYYAYLTAFRARYYLDKEPGSFVFDESIIDPNDMYKPEMFVAHDDMDTMYFT